MGLKWGKISRQQRTGRSSLSSCGVKADGGKHRQGFTPATLLRIYKEAVQAGCLFVDAQQQVVA
jgi:hypothetical protein